MLHPIILAGSVHPSSDRQAGEGPMHFERSPGIPSRFEQVVAHLTGEVFASPLVVATQDCGPLVEAQSNHARIILQPDTHKPAAALLSAVLSLRHEPDAIVVVAPASANLEDQKALDTALCQAIPAAQRGEVVMLGHRTGRAYPGFGVMEIADQPRDTAPVSVSQLLASGRQTTLSHLLQGNHQLWGLGIYIARVDVLIAAFKRHASRLFLPVKNALLRAATAGRAIYLDNSSYQRVKCVSFERAVGQKLEHVSAIQMDTSWTELSDWDRDAVADREMSAWDTDLAQEQAGEHSHTAEMMSVYKSLANASEDDALMSRASEHEWGRHETLAMGPGFTLQRLTVQPGAQVELSAGAGSAEHWIVVQGAALITLGGHVKLVWESQSARIPAGRTRMIENPGSATLHLVQLQISALSAPSDHSMKLSVSPAGVA
ncbi:mannose-6-phosphate isomerase [Tritonibacter scottomollicae]|uniref:Mannose-6-phosphate isomerase n=1 Tax=Tritonibacter scottomollicae TaxID=483013 RepID=A0ABZ0HI83_TRISK|nr:mannose-6-phosphate isomerase [Tritonibacter scottomollicae]WOI33981.1 mannose-6-phosphate isomerase [Tritonibacter scottomollicae]